MTDAAAQPIGGRRAPRPRTVEACQECGRALGAGYAECCTCRTVVDEIWLADWRALLAQEGIVPGTAEERLLAQAVLGEFGPHPWTVLDVAMSLLRCGTCGGELGESCSDCAECGQAFGMSIAAEFEATANEHALHIGRWVLRYPKRHSAASVAAWLGTLPRILTGWLPSTAEAQRGMALLKAGRVEEWQAALARVDAEIAAQQMRKVSNK